ACLARFFEDPEREPRGEMFRLLQKVRDEVDLSEDQIVDAFVLRKCGRDLAGRLKAIVAYESVCGILEEAFDWIRFLSTHSRERPIDARTFAAEVRTGALVRDLMGRLGAAEQALAVSPLNVQQQFAQLAKGFAGVRDATELFETVLTRHDAVQRAKLRKASARGSSAHLMAQRLCVCPTVSRSHQARHTAGSAPIESTACFP